MQIVCDIIWKLNASLKINPTTVVEFHALTTKELVISGYFRLTIVILTDNHLISVYIRK